MIAAARGRRRDSTRSSFAAPARNLPGWVAVLYGGDGRANRARLHGRQCLPANRSGGGHFQYSIHEVLPPCTTWQQMDDVASINVQTLPNAARCLAMGNMVLLAVQDGSARPAALVIDQFFDGGGHWDHGPLGRVTENRPRDGARWWERRRRRT